MKRPTAVLCLLFSLSVCASGATAPRPTIIVQDFKNRSYEVKFDWVGIGLAYLVRKDLGSIGAFSMLEDRRIKLEDPDPIAEFLIDGEVRLDESQPDEPKFLVFVTLDRTQGEAVRRQFLTEGAASQLFDMAEYLSERIARYMDIEVTDAVRGRFARGMTRDFAAFQQFAEAMVERRIHVKLEAYERALMLDPSFAEAGFHLARVFTILRNYDSATAQLRRVLEQVPDHAGAHNDLAYVLAQQGRADEALAEYREAIRADPTDPKFHLNLGDLLALKGRVLEAEHEYRLAMRLRPGDPEAVASLERLRGIGEAEPGGSSSTTASPTPAVIAQVSPARPGAMGSPAVRTPHATGTPLPRATPQPRVTPQPVSTPGATPQPRPPATSPPSATPQPSPTPRPPATPPPSATPQPSATPSMPRSTPQPGATPVTVATYRDPADEKELSYAREALKRPRGDAGEANRLLDEAERALDRSPSDFYAGLGRLYAHQGMSHAAVDALRRAYELAPESTEIRALLADSYERIGRRKQAEELRSDK